MSNLNSIATGLGKLSLGISIVVAVAIGVWLGLGLKSLTGATWTLYVGVALGVGAAILNVYKAYLQSKKELDELKYRYEFNDSSSAKSQELASHNSSKAANNTSAEDDEEDEERA